MRSILVLAMVVVGACDSGAPTCKDAVTKARNADDKMSFDSAAKLVGKCELKDWNIATRQCIAKAKSRHELDACTDKLTPEDHAQMLEAMAAMTHFKDEMCQCTTNACAQNVSDEMTKWGQEQARDRNEPPKLTDEETKQFTDLGEQMGKCMQKAMSEPPPPVAPEPAPPVPPTDHANRRQ